MVKHWENKLYFKYRLNVKEQKENNIFRFILTVLPLPSGLAVTQIVLCIMKQNTAWDPQTGESWLFYSFNSSPVVIWNNIPEPGRPKKKCFFLF